MASQIKIKHQSSSNNKNYEILKKIMGSNVLKRTVLGIIMLSLFISLCKGRHENIIVFTIILTLGITYELIMVVKSPGETMPIKLPIVIWISVVLYSICVVPQILLLYPECTNVKILLYYKIILFFAYGLGLMMYIGSLKKQSLRLQLLLLATIHIAVYLMGKSCCYAIKNIVRGKFYYFYPAILVISNDIFAYIVGKTIGKRQLFSLSPNKTLEGFIGAFFFTTVTGAFLSHLKLKYKMFPDGLDVIMALPCSSTIKHLEIPVLYFHNLMFCGYASFVAPFAGFLGSAIKRAFKRKDFGAIIPGHGGLTDRMDCQLLMVFFTHLYLKSFVIDRNESVLKLAAHIKNNYTEVETRELINKLID